MDRNVGGRDRLVRLVVGPVLITAALLVVVNAVSLGLSPEVRFGVVLALLVVGGILLGTGSVRKCPVNEAAGVDTYDDSD